MSDEQPFRVRRVVAGENAAGQSIVLADTLVPVVNGTPDYLQVAELWRTEGIGPMIPARADSVDPAVADIRPSIGGTRFVIEVAHPEGTNGRDEASVQRMFEAVSGAHSRTKSGPDLHPGMHQTDTIDYIVVLQGEIDFILEAGEVHLKAGDMVVDTGVNHSWANRSGKLCVLAAIMIGMERQQDTRTVDGNT